MRRPALMLMALWLSAATLAAGSLEVLEPRARVSAKQQAEVYFTLRNNGSEQDRLIGASSPLASSIKLLTTVQLGAVSSVQPLKSIGVPAAGQQLLAPGHTRMVLSLKRALAPGEALPLTLQFEKTGEQRIQVPQQP